MILAHFKKVKDYLYYQRGGRRIEGDVPKSVYGQSQRSLRTSENRMQLLDQGIKFPSVISYRIRYPITS